VLTPALWSALLGASRTGDEYNWQEYQHQPHTQDNCAIYLTEANEPCIVNGAKATANKKLCAFPTFCSVVPWCKRRREFWSSGTQFCTVGKVKRKGCQPQQNKESYKISQH
jgi:hypothetical protein